MNAMQAHPHQGLDGLTLVDLPDPGDPGPHAIRVRVHATSLNFPNLGVVTQRHHQPCRDILILFVARLSSRSPRHKLEHCRAIAGRTRCHLRCLRLTVVTRPTFGRVPQLI